MAQTLETRAARLVHSLEAAGHKVASLTIKGDEITVVFVGGEPEGINPFDLVDMRRDSKKPKRG